MNAPSGKLYALDALSGWVSAITTVRAGVAPYATAVWTRFLAALQPDRVRRSIVATNYSQSLNKVPTRSSASSSARR